MRFHGRLTDPSFAPYFEVFKRRVIAIYNSGVRHYDHWTGDGTFNVQMRITGEDVYVTLLGLGTGYFEFQTTGMPFEQNPDFPPTFGVSVPLVNVVTVDLTAGVGVQAVSHIAGGAKNANAFTISPIGRPQQVQLVDEPVRYPGPVGPRKTYPNVMFESYAPQHSHTGLYMRAYQCAYLPYHFNNTTPNVWAHESRDVGYDEPWADNSNRNHWRGTATPVTTRGMWSPVYQSLANGADWPRRAGQRTVVSSTWGTRDFAVSVDAFDQVSVFPKSSITQPLGTGIQNVTQADVQMHRVSFPGWTFAKTQRFSDYFAAPDAGDSLGTGNLTFPEIDWHLHPDCMEMCAVVHERVEAQLDTTFFGAFATDTGTLGPGDFYPTATSFYQLNSRGMGVEAMARSSTASVMGDKWYHVAPGLLKVSIDIVLTGLNPGDFTVTLTTTEVRRPTTTPYCSFVAGYVFHDVFGKRKDDGTIPKDAARGDMCVLDIECYGDTTTGYNGQLYSVKNLTTGKEIRTFGAATQHTSAIVAADNPLTGSCLLLAYCMQTLSFVTKDQIIVREIDGIDAASQPIMKMTQHFGVSVRVMGAYKETFFPTILAPEWRSIITANARWEDARALLFAQFGVMSLMPLNDLRTWGDADLDSLREWYCRAFTHQTYTPGFDPFENWSQMETFGNKYYKLGARDHPFPSATTLNWYNSCMAQDNFRPFPMFDVTEPRPGWYLYAYQIMSKLYISPSANCFFTHPNGTWAYFNQEFIYNANGVRASWTAPGGNIRGSTIADLNLDKFEHCIFDRIHFVLAGGMGGDQKKDTSFLEQYNNAVVRDTRTGAITDDTTTMAKDYSDMRIKFSVTPVNDVFDYRVSYAKVQGDWYKGYTFTMRDTGYFDGEKVWANTFDSTSDGSLVATTLCARWTTIPPVLSQIMPIIDNWQALTFSTCMLITP